MFHMILALSFSINAVVVRTMVWSDRSQSHTDRVDNAYGRMVLASCHAVHAVYKLYAIAEQAHIMWDTVSCFWSHILHLMSLTS